MDTDHQEDNSGDTHNDDIITSSSTPSFTESSSPALPTPNNNPASKIKIPSLKMGIDSINSSHIGLSRPVTPATPSVNSSFVDSGYTQYYREYNLMIE